MQYRSIGTVTSGASQGLGITIRALLPAMMGAQMLLGSAHAGVQFVPHAAVGYEYNSNLFLVNDDSPRTDPDGQQRFEDSYINYGGGLDVVGNWGEQKLALNSDIRHFVYDHFNQLDRNDQLLSMVLDWTATSKISGKASARYDQHQTPFTELNDATIAAVAFSQIDRIFDLSANYQLTSKWGVNAAAGYSRTTVPSTGFGQSYDLQQIPRKIGVKYGGTAQLVLGVSIEANDGMYLYAVNAPDFHQTRYQGTLDYTFSPRTSVSATAGYTQYSQLGLDTSANVGSFVFNQQLTGKTKYYLRYDREFDAYPTTQGSQLATTVSGGITWQALTKISLSASYGETKSKVSSNPLGPGLNSDARDEKLKSTQVSLNYDMLRWLTIAPYYRYQQRDSNLSRYSFHNKVYGATVSVRYQ